jgi:hypothetical protein
MDSASPDQRAAMSIRCEDLGLSWQVRRLTVRCAARTSRQGAACTGSCRGAVGQPQSCELANRCCADRAEVIATAQVGSIRVRRDPELLRSFLAGTGLTL